MILDDGQGNVLNTEPLTLEQDIRNHGVALNELKKKINKEGRTNRRQSMQVRYDSLLVKYKKLIKMLEKRDGKQLSKMDR
jgi:ribosomal protein S21